MIARLIGWFIAAFVTALLLRAIVTGVIDYDDGRTSMSAKRSDEPVALDHFLHRSCKRCVLSLAAASMINAAVNAQQSSCVGQPMNNQMDIFIRGLIAGAAVVGLTVALNRALVTGVINGIDGGPVSRSTEAGAFWTTFLLATLALTFFIWMLVL